MAQGAMKASYTLEKGQTTVGVVLGGRSAERAISLETGAAVAQALEQRGHRVVTIDLGHDPCAQFRDAGIDVAFIALHGRWGEDGCVQGFLECLGIPYTGSSVRASAIALDKVTSKRLFGAGQLPTPSWRFPAKLADGESLGFPLVLKPPAEGSSVGLEIVRDKEQLREQLAQEAASPRLAETYVKGRELTVAVLGAGDDARALGTLEIRPAAGNYDYEAKYQRTDTKYLVPAPIPVAVEKRLSELAVAAQRLLGCSGATRVDFRWDDKNGREPMILEINTLPGLTTHSLLPKIAEHQGMSYGELVEWILADASLKV